jgi:NADH:ubiquinone oxidoreductase subunit 6 (subunit J)
MKNRTFSILFFLFCALGGGIAYFLGSLKHLETFKILNIVGMIYGLIGVVVLSEFVAQNEKWRRFMVEKISGLLIWAHGTIPLGAALTSLALYLVSRDEFPSSEIVGKSFMGFALYAVLPTFFVEDYVFSPKTERHKDPILRTRIFGLFLVISGMLVQLIAAIQDLLRA